MADNVNTSSQFTADIQNFIQKKTIRLVDRQLVLYQFGDKAVLPKNRGTVYTASQYNRVNLPFAPLSEGIPPVGETMTLTQVSATAQQWGDTINVTDVADLTIDHPIFQKAIELIALQQAETLERNTANVLMGGTQVNYVGAVGSRASLTSTSYLNPFELNRAVGALRTIGAPEFMGQANEDEKIEAGKPSKASKDPRGFQHYVAVLHPLVEQDMRNNSQVVTAWSYSDINRLYNNELGEYAGIRFTRSNMVPYFTGVAAITATGHTTGGSLADGTYYTEVTGSVAQNGYETLIYQVSSSVTISGGGGNGSITLTMPSTAGYLYNVYIGTTTSPTNLGLSASGPTVGPLAGNAVQIAPSTAVTITGVGVSRTPPAAPATGVTVYPTFIFGKGAYAQVMLDEAKVTYLDKAEKLDPLNQLRIVGWKIFYGTLIINQQFFMRIESASQFSPTFG
jgi:N4-gp56 family major capsid protein